MHKRAVEAAKPESGGKRQDAGGASIEAPPLEDFRYDILVAYVHQLRILAWMAGEEQLANVWTTLGKVPSGVLETYNPDIGARDLGLSWDDVAHTDFAAYLEAMYHYAYYGLYDTGWEPMEDETGFTWISALLLDMEKSYFLYEWVEGYSGEGRSSIERCREAAELANARLILETGEPFSFLLCARGKDEDVDADSLTVRQMALLAGMEEMSIRAAANPKRSNALKTFSENGRTRIALDVAKEWLKSKGRYVPIRKHNTGRNTALGKRPFRNLQDLFLVVRSRLLYVSPVDTEALTPAEQEVLAYLTNKAEQADEGEMFELEAEQPVLSAPQFLQSMAKVLQFPAELLALRVRELMAKEELVSVQRRLKNLSST